MDNNNSNRNSQSSHAYDPNNLSIFPDLLQPVNQVLQPQAVIPESFVRVIQPTRIFTVLDERYLILELGTAPGPTFNSNPAAWTHPGQTSHIHSEGRPTVLRQTSNIHPAISTVSGTTPNIHPAGRVPRPRRSAARSRAQSQDSDSSSGCPPGEEPPVPQPVARENNVNCPICMNPFLELTAANCGHVFCRQCIAEVYEVHPLCPICRRTITRRGLFRIYLS